MKLLIHDLEENVLKDKSGDNIFISPNFPKIAFRIAGNSFWNSMAKANNLKRKDLYTMEK